MTAALLSIFKGTVGMDSLFLIAFACFAGGFLIKSAIVFKQRKRILRLEDEMLSNHARILSLERRVSDQKKNNLINSEDVQKTEMIELISSM